MYQNVSYRNILVKSEKFDLNALLKIHKHVLSHTHAKLDKAYPKYLNGSMYIVEGEFPIAFSRSRHVKEFRIF